MEVSLRGLVLDKYRSASEFGKDLGWNRKKASDIVNGRRRPTADEMEQIASRIGVKDNTTFFTIFFPHMVHNVD